MKINRSVVRIIVLLFLLLLVCSVSFAADSAKPNAPVDDWQGTNFNTAYSASVSAVRPFDPSVHEQMTPSGAICSEQLNAAIYRQDILHAFESNAHFDNCAFDSSYDYIQSLLVECQRQFGSVPEHWQNKDAVPESILDGILTLGQVLHSVQDFYAHSNYVELMQKITPVPKREQDIPVVSIWTYQGHQQVERLVQKGLVSGRVWWTLPQHCNNDVPIHAELAKDSANSNAGARLSIWNRAVGNKKQKNYNVASNLAHRGTREFLQWCGERWPQIEKYCGKTVKYIVTKDMRQADKPEHNPRED